MESYELALRPSKRGETGRQVLKDASSDSISLEMTGPPGGAVWYLGEHLLIVAIPQTRHSPAYINRAAPATPAVPAPAAPALAPAATAI
jgi:hypothetical protein